MTGQPTDEQLREDLRAIGVARPVPATELAMYRRYREFDGIEKLRAIPVGGGRFHRALIRLGIAPPLAKDDGGLVAASVEMRAALLDLNASGSDATDEEDRQAWLDFDLADQVITATPATTVAGAVAKLLRALTMDGAEDWVTRAIADGDITTLAARAEELSGTTRLLVEAVCALALAEAAK